MKRTEQSAPVAMVVTHEATVRLEWASVGAAHNAKPGPLYASSSPATEPDERSALIAQVGEEMSFEAWFKTMCPVDGINAKIAARAAWQARALAAPPAPAPTEPAKNWTGEYIAAWNQTYPRMDIYAKPGSLVVFDGMGGHDLEKRQAEGVLAKRQAYEVSRIDVGGCSSRVQLKGVNGWFNTCLFATPPSAAAQPEAVGEPTGADWADFGAWTERDKGAMDMLGKLIDVWDDGQLPHEHRCYVDGAWAELIAEARALCASAPTAEATSSPSDAERLDWAADAREWGNALNSAGWEFDSAYRRHIGENAPAKLFNFCKPIIRDAILKYAERVAAIRATKGGEL